MGTSTFKAGAIVEIDGQSHQLMRKIEGDLWQIEVCRNRKLIELTDQALLTLYMEGKLKFPSRTVPAGSERAARLSPALDQDPKQWERAKVRRAYVEAVLDLPANRERIGPQIAALWERLKQPELKPHVATVLRWKARYLNAGRDITALMDNHAAKGNTQPRYPKPVLDIVQEAIQRRYLRPERATRQATLELALVQVQRENNLRPAADQLPRPTRRLVDRMIDEIPAFERCVARHGRVEALKRFRTVIANRTTGGPLERAEMDHTLANVLVIDDDTCLPLGRPWLTGCIDDYTRNVLGVYVSFTPPSYFTVARCLKQAILPKVTLLQQYPEIQHAWAAHGVMRELVVDNGAEFHSVSLENACLSLGIEIHYAARKTPWFKGKIERFLGTLNTDLSNGTPGTTFAGILAREDYDPAEHAVVRYSVFKEMLYRWIVDVYHQKPHRALDTTPAVMWANSIAPEDIQLPDDPVQLDAILGESRRRRLTHKGIELEGLLYNSRELGELRYQLGEKLDVEVRVDAADLGQIFVLSPDQRQIFRVPALRADYARGLSAWQHDIIRRYARQQLAQDGTEGWLEAKERIAEMIEGEFRYKRKQTRARVARYREKDAIVVATPIAEAAPVISVPDPFCGEVDLAAGAATGTVRHTAPGAAPVVTPAPAPAARAVVPSKRFAPVFRNRGAVASES